MSWWTGSELHGIRRRPRTFRHVSTPAPQLPSLQPLQRTSNAADLHSSSSPHLPMLDSPALRCLPPFPATSQSPLVPFRPTPSSFSPLPRRRSCRFVVRSSARDPEKGEDDGLGFYPWDPRAASLGDSGIQWVPEDKITLFTSDGLVQIGGSLVPRQVPPINKSQGKSKSSQRYQKFQESDYMDPGQVLCLGALFDIAATNGLDTGRRLCIYGFCRSIEMLNDIVEDTVLEHGGEVVVAEKESKGGLHEKLSMIVQVPLLWGVPPASETLHVAVRSGGGIIEKVYWQWDFL